MNDHIGSAHMTQGNLTTFTLDRFGNQNSALALNGGWTQVPAGIYFDTPEFTISVWFMPQQVSPWARLIDFGSGPGTDNIVLVLNDANNNRFPIVGFENVYLISSKPLIPYEWHHLASTFDGHTLNIYINGTLTDTKTFSSFIQLSILNRTHNYVGKSNWNGDGYSFSFIDDLRFYKKNLTQTQINELVLLNVVESTVTTGSKTTTRSRTTSSG
jgi:hypothetical protein